VRRLGGLLLLLMWPFFIALGIWSYMHETPFEPINPQVSARRSELESLRFIVEFDRTCGEIGAC
jgi:hypothetical protein